jgi:hypothetical protein
MTLQKRLELVEQKAGLGRRMLHVAALPSFGKETLDMLIAKAFENSGTVRCPSDVVLLTGIPSRGPPRIANSFPIPGRT